MKLKTKYKSELKQRINMRGAWVPFTALSQGSQGLWNLYTLHKDQNNNYQISKEIVASARQSNQKEILVAQKTELDTAYEMAKTKLSDASLKGRASLLKHLLSEAKKVGEGKMVLRPTVIDRSALEDASKDYSIGEEVDGMGGFILEAADGSISFDYRFDGLLEEAWSTLLPKITGELF